MFVLLEIHWSKLLQLELCAACLSLWPLCLCRPTWARWCRRSWAQETVADLARPTRGGGTRIAAPHSRLWCSCGAAQSRVFAADKQWRVAPTHLRHQTHSAAQRKKCFGILIKIWQHTKVNITFCGRNRFPGKVSIYHLLPYPCPICYLRYTYIHCIMYPPLDCHRFIIRIVSLWPKSSRSSLSSLPPTAAIANQNLPKEWTGETALRPLVETAPLQR